MIEITYLTKRDILSQKEARISTTHLANPMVDRRSSKSYPAKIPVVLALRCILGSLFAYSGVVKLMDVERFTVIIAGFGLLPKELLHPAAIFLPLAELFCGLGLIVAVRGCLTAIALMLLLFMAVLGWGIHLGLDIDCGCFGPEDPEQAYKGLKVALVRDAAMMAAVITLYWHNRRAQQAPANR